MLCYFTVLELDRRGSDGFSRQKSCSPTALGDPDGQAVQAAMGLMAMVSGTADAKGMDPEQLVDYLVEQLNAGQARRIAGTNSPLPKELLASIPAPGT